MNMKIKKLTKTATIPTRGSEGAAGYDLYADILEPVTIKPHETVKIETGIAIQVPKGHFGGIFARSGLSIKEGLLPGNACGIIDEDYIGPVIVGLHNSGNVERTVIPQQKIAQLVIIPYVKVDFDEVDELEETERGTGGFGSTGK